MNVKLIRAEWRAVCKASMELMHRGLSMVGLLSVVAVALVVTHPDALRDAALWVLPEAGGAAEAASTPAPAVDPLVGAIVHPSAEAGRLLGLVVPGTAEPAIGSGVAMDRVSMSKSPTAMSREQRDATTYLSRKYRVNSDAVAMLVDAAYSTGRDLHLDPLLLLSVMGVESGFNPFAESTAGASGLMQLVSKVHRDKLNDFGGANIALNPVVNLRVGAVVLKDCIRRGGSIADGLRLYVGAGNGFDGGYGSRVLQEKDRLAQAIHEPGRVHGAPLADAHADGRADNGEDRRSDVPSPEERTKASRSSSILSSDHDDAAGSPPASTDERRDGVDDPDHGRFDHGRIASL